MPQVVVHFQLTQREWVQGMRCLLLRGRRLLIVAALGLVIVVAGADLVPSAGESRGIGGVYLVFGIAVWLGVGLAWLVGPSTLWRKNDVLRGAQSLALSDQGAAQRTIYSDSRSLWPMFSHTYEAKETYLLKASQGRIPVVVPKRAFASSDDERTFRELVARHTQAHLVA